MRRTGTFEPRFPRCDPRPPHGGDRRRGASVVATIATIATIGLLGAALLPLAAHDQIPGAPQATPVLLKGGDLHTAAGDVLRATDLLFEGGKIVAIGENLPAPAGAETIDVTGKRVYPGLIAMQTSLGLVEIGAVKATRDQSEMGDVTPEVAAHIAFNPDSEILPTVRSNGVTTVQSVPSGGLISGRGFVVQLDGWTREDAGLVADDGVHMNWPRASVIRAWWMQQSEEEQKKQMKERREAIRRVFDEARAYDAARDAGSAAVDTRHEAMRPLFSREKPLWIYADDSRQIEEALLFLAEQDLDGVLVGGREAHLVAERIAGQGVPVVLSQTHATPYREDDDYDLPFKQPAMLKEAGVRFALTKVSSWDARNLAFQAGQAVAFGLDEATALAAITRVPAEILGLDDRTGTLEVGKDATLFVSDGDVMDYLGHGVSRMWIEGRAVDLDDRHKMLWRKYDRKVKRSAR